MIPERGPSPWALLFVVAALTIGGLILATPAARPDGYVRPTVTLAHYGAGLGPAADAPVDVQPEWAKRLEAKVDKLLKLIEEEAAKGADEAAPVAGAGRTAGSNLQAGAEVCAKCHAADVFKADGGGFQIFTDKGEFRDFSERDLRKIVAELEGQTMPPPKSKVALPKAQHDALLEAFKPKR
jgi:mono/diheme cytochrome c family protein